ncbi:zinc finger protein RFP-like isoform X2 [Pyrgilauda ruficollis]|uniref:zinc finger protein RFP-like isoform X2 n=1 Tax=Pyrgilauda ruficollis TaxID=221976 RepID=UPI001B8662EA|nr:zinc finger protein RFP-like isoform X2 [Pyrgilauda ruficollis]
MEALPGSARCPVCLEYFREPVSIHCGHHFCRRCIERCWEWPTARFACPRCRDAAPVRSLRPSPELERLLEIARRLSRGEALAAGEEEEEEGCQKHREPLEVFCKEDGALLCAICRESRAHRAHTVLPVPEAVRECKEQIQAGLQSLKDGRDKLLEFREAEMRRNLECLVNAAEQSGGSARPPEKTEAERQRILSQFQGLRLALEELCCHLLARLGRLESRMGKVQEENLTRLTQEISRLDSRVQELEEKCQQPARTFLQDIGSTLSSLAEENLQLPPSPLPELEEKIHRFREENLLLGETLRSVRDILAFELPEKTRPTPSFGWRPTAAASSGRAPRTFQNPERSPKASPAPTPPCWAARASRPGGAAGTCRCPPRGPGRWGWPGRPPAAGQRPPAAGQRPPAAGQRPPGAGQSPPSGSCGPWGSARASSGLSPPWSASRSLPAGLRAG